MSLIMEALNLYLSQVNQSLFGEIQEKYAQFYTRGGFQFHAHSTEEDAFLEEIQSRGLAHFIRKISTVFKSLQEIDNDYCYLSPGHDRDYIPGAFIDIDNPCYRGEGPYGILCLEGAQQYKKIVINTRKTKLANDIMSLYNLPLPIIVSKRLRNLLKDEVATGIEFVPCLDERMTFTAVDLVFNEPVPHLEEDALFFQLVITNELNYPVITRKVKTVKRCPRCGTVHYFYAIATGEDIDVLEKIDNPPFDFTLCRTFTSENEGEFKMPWGIKLVSRRMVQLFETHKIKGIQPYSKEHKANPYRVVPVRTNS